MRTGKLTITLGSGRAIKDMDIVGGSSDPYIVFSVDRKDTKRSRTQANSSSPNWDESFDFEVTDEAQYLYIECYDEDSFKPDDLIGVAKVDLYRVMQQSPLSDWFQIRASNGSSTGEIHLNLSLEFTGGATPVLTNPQEVLGWRPFQPTSPTF
ncbi:hypothetical protein K7432_002347 [Basidiobolus ranarum]|uniref:C2 domain-containing protein n=1 Tax=Basidiobolus ranarum TaxID=34480 RepID=A0ABR2W8W4_9FUNG